MGLQWGRGDRGKSSGKKAGQQIKIPAKPAIKAPRFTFRKTFKEVALKAKAKK